MKLNLSIFCCLAALTLVSCRVKVVKIEKDVAKRYRNKLEDLKSDVVEVISEAKIKIDGTRSLIPKEFAEAYATFKTNVKNLFASEADYENKIKPLDSNYS